MCQAQQRVLEGLPVWVAALILFLVPFGSASPQTFSDRSVFEASLGSVATVDFEGIATQPGQAGAVNLNGNEFPGLTLTAAGDAEGLFVGIPDFTVPSPNNDLHFFAEDFFPVSGVALFSPDLTGTPIGLLIVDFYVPTTGVGGFFLDVEGAVSFIEAFDGPGGTGNSLGKLTLQNKGDNTQAFAGIAASGIRSAVFSFGGGEDGVGLDDLCFVPPQQVTIDIKPGSDPNCFNIDGNGVIPVAILGSAQLDVNEIVLNSLLFDGLQLRVRGNRGPFCSTEEVNGDSYPDLVCQFEDDPENWTGGSTTGTLTGSLIDGTSITGTDSICLVP